MIYMVKMGDLPYLKIGYTENMMSRIKHLQNASPLLVECIAERNGSYMLEKAVQNACKRFAFRNEWFSDCEEVRNMFFSVKDPAPFGLNMKATTDRLRKEKQQAANLFGVA